MVEYDCIDCNCRIVLIVLDEIPDPPLCMECAVIRSLPEEDRPALRKIFHKGVDSTSIG